MFTVSVSRARTCREQDKNWILTGLSRHKASQNKTITTKWQTDEISDDGASHLSKNESREGKSL